MPWQEQVAMVGGEIDPDTGFPAYKEVIVTVPRQSGKTTVVLSWEVQRAVGALQWGGPQRIVYSAQNGTEARNKLVDDQFPLLEPRQHKLGITRLLRSNGREGIVWRNGSRLRLLASTASAGHGKVVDLGVQDELFEDSDHYRAQSMAPAMLTRPAAQMLISSTAGTASSVALNAAVERGRQAVDGGARTGTAYFEWSMPDGCDIDNPDQWWQWMPALGYTQTPATVAHAMSLVPQADERRRAYGNVATTVTSAVIPAAVWDVVCGPKHEVPMAAGVTFALDVNPERSAAAIVASDGTICELVEYNPGTAWVVPRVVELAAKYSANVALDPAGPAGSLIRDLAQAEVAVVEVSGREMLQACAAFYDDVADRKVKIRQSNVLDAAVAGAERKQVGDAWCWARRSSATDVCPLVALTLAAWVAGGGDDDAGEGVALVL